MLQVSPSSRILVALEPVDFRRGIDGLARLCQQALQTDPMSGTLFIFRNRRGTGLKVIVYDGQGFWLCYKRLSSGYFRHWPRQGTGQAIELRAHELQILLFGGDPLAINILPDWRPLPRLY